MPKVTIAILTYNREAYLKECLKSIREQSFHDFRIIIFDNHSDYNIEKVISDFKDLHIFLIRNPENIGGAANFELASNYQYDTEYVIIFHDDDTMHPEMLMRETTALDSNPEAVFVGTNLNFVSNQAKMLNFKKFTERNSLLVLKDKSDLVRLLLRDFDLGFSTIMYRHKFLINFKFNNEPFFKWADRPFLVALAGEGGKGSTVLVLRDKLINYRIHINQDSQANAIDKQDYLFNLFEFYRDNLSQPLNTKDKHLFNYFSTNQLVMSGSIFSNNFNEYVEFLKSSKKLRLFYFKYLNIRGLYYFLKVLKIFLLKSFVKNVKHNF